MMWVVGGILFLLRRVRPSVRVVNQEDNPRVSCPAAGLDPDPGRGIKNCVLADPDPARESITTCISSQRFS